MNNTFKNHWENVYTNKQPHEVSWTQEVPQTSLDFIKSFQSPKTASIIDIGGGDSNLVDYLLAEGYTDITVLDISSSSLEKAKLRLGENSSKVKWIVSDITEFKPERKYQIWHDRATFHFLTSANQIKEYLKIANTAIAGFLAIGTFSDNGPTKCSNLNIKQYSEADLQSAFEEGFSKIKCVNEDHRTPFNTIQNFTFCSFRKI
ncbi:MAG: class I SAM-dependent methyltransferase [Opitutaceae bacterium]|nr:class I SAM-dependent methyltransferase [Cytophagales bacterium]